MQEEPLQFERNDVWELVPRPNFANIIGCEKYQMDVKRSSFAPIAYLEAIRLLLRVSCLLNFKLYQMNMNNSFFKWIHE